MTSSAAYTNVTNGDLYSVNANGNGYFTLSGFDASPAESYSDALQQGVFQNPIWGQSYGTVNDFAVFEGAVVGAGIVAPAAFDVGMTAFAEWYGSGMATANGTNGVMIGAYYEGSALSYEGVAEAQGMNYEEQEPCRAIQHD
jgi:hypothetical protein